MRVFSVGCVIVLSTLGCADILGFGQGTGGAGGAGATGGGGTSTTGGTGGTGATGGGGTTSAGGTGGTGGTTMMGDCLPGAVEACYEGPQGTSGLGLCEPGTRTCQEDGAWGTCLNQVLPAPEDCDTPADESCDGIPDCHGAHDWSKLFGGVGLDQARDVAVDPDGNIFLAAIVQGTIAQDVKLMPGDMPKGGSDILVLKLDPEGNPVWGRRFGSAAEDFANTVALDAQGNIFVGGVAGAVDFGGGQILDAAGAPNAFVFKLNPTGGVEWAKAYGGADHEEITDLAVDGEGNVLAAGRYTGAPAFGAPGPMPGTGVTYNAFAAKIMGAGPTSGTVVWARGYGSGQAAQEATSITADGAGDVLVAMNLRGALDLAPGLAGGEHSSLDDSSADILIAKLSKTDGGWIWSRQFGEVPPLPAADQRGAYLSLVAGDLVVAAMVTGDVDLKECGVSLGATADLVLMRLAPDQAGKCLSADRRDVLGVQEPSSLDVDGAGNLLVTGSFTQTFDWSGSLAPQPLSPPTPNSRFVLKLQLDPAAQPPTKYRWQRAFPSAAPNGVNFSTSGALTPLGGAVIAGTTWAPVDLGGGQLGVAGNTWEIFVTGLAP